MSYLVFLIQAYNTTEKNMDGSNRLEDIVHLRLICDSANEALKRAKNIISKNHYRLSEVNEFNLPEVKELNE